MQQSVFHGILLDLSFVDHDFPSTFQLFAHKKVGEWGLYGISVPRDQLEQALLSIQAHMRTDGQFYNHLYDDQTLIAIFKTRIFRTSTHLSGWNEIHAYGLSLGIPAQQLDFWPNRFQDEIHYFEREDFVEKA